MVKRLIALLGMTVVVVAIAAALLAGAASASAETGSGSDGEGTKSSASTQQTSPKTESGTNKPEAKSSGDSQKPAEHTESGQDHGDTPGSATAETSAGEPAESGSGSAHPEQSQEASGELPTASPSAPSKEATNGSAVKPPSEPSADEPATEDTARPASKRAKTRNDEQDSARPDTGGAADRIDAAVTVASDQPTPEPISSAPVEPDSSLAESHDLAQTAFPQTTEVTAARSTVALTEQVSAPRAPTLIDVVGSIVLNLVMGLIHVFDGPPVLPAGSNVTVRTSTLRIPVAGGQTVEADWYFPNGGEAPTRLIYLQHGLLASGPMYSYTAATLAEQTHSIVVAPSLTSNWFDIDGAWLGGTPMQRAVADLFVGDRADLTESASAAAGYDATLPTRFVLAGHSLGGTLVMGAAGYMVDNGAIDDLAGVLLLDSVDLNNAVPTALQKLTGINDRPVLLISSERYVWNMNGRVSDELEAARPGRFNGVMLVGGRHIDALQGGNPLIQFSEYLIAGFSHPQNVEAVKTLAVGWVNDMFAGTHDGIYGAPQESIEIATAAGTATAVVLPMRSAQVSPIDLLLQALLDFAARNFFVYEPLAGRPSALTAV